MTDLIKKISPALVREFLSYDLETGRLFWNERMNATPGWNTRFSGKETALCAGSDGYKQLNILCKTYRAHHISWVIFYGEWPERFIDHIDGDKTNNAIGNLRLATSAQNNQNSSRRKTSISGLKGVSWNKARQKWVAQISHNKQAKQLGYFEDKNEAYKAYCRAARDLHGDFARVA